MDLQKSKRLLIILAVVFWAYATCVYVVSFEQFRIKTVTKDVSSPEYVL